MKKSFAIIASAMLVMPAVGQETYENARLANTDLNGTARYVGMGGAMEALGADISTVSTNPAGMGLARHSSVGVSAGLQMQHGAENFGTGKKTNLSFDQAGFVISRVNDNKTLNFAFNYHKSRNFNQILQAADVLDNASQNKLSATKGYQGWLYETDGRGVPNFRSAYLSCNQIDALYASTAYHDFLYDSSSQSWLDTPATGYQMDRSQQGYISDFDFNISGGNGRVWLGLTMGIHDVHYKHYSLYQENLNETSTGNSYQMAVSDDRRITGQGLDIKAGIIFRPIEESPLRFGLSVATPTWYTLTTSNMTAMTLRNKTKTNSDSYKFKVYTPWKFGLSAGYTIGTEWALGLSYEYADYSSTDSRRITGSSYSSWGGSYSEESESDVDMNRHTTSTLKGVHTLKAGVELKATKNLAVRLGYNFVSPLYSKTGFKDGTLQSEGSYYSSSTDFTNWKATNRITCGLGYQMDKWNLALAYQYSVRNGDFYPFASYIDAEDASYDNIAGAVKVEDKRHRVMATLTYTF